MVAITHPATTRPTRRRPSVATAATYRRRRLVAAALVLLLAVSLATTAARLRGGAGEFDRARPVAELSVLVEPGDTVWSIAESVAGGGDVRPVVDAIVDANGGAGLVAGDRLTIVLP